MLAPDPPDLTEGQAAKRPDPCRSNRPSRAQLSVPGSTFQVTFPSRHSVQLLSLGDERFLVLCSDDAQHFERQVGRETTLYDLGHAGWSRIG
jgi:hypothetical protein